MFRLHNRAQNSARPDKKSRDTVGTYLKVRFNCISTFSFPAKHYYVLDYEIRNIKLAPRPGEYFPFEKKKTDPVRSVRIQDLCSPKRFRYLQTKCAGDKFITQIGS